MDTRYRLKKDLPCAEVGEIFQQGYDENDEDNIYLFQEILGVKQIKIWLDYIDDFDEWFEEVEEIKVPDEFYIPVIYADKRQIGAIKVSDVVNSPSILQTMFSK